MPELAQAQPATRLPLAEWIPCPRAGEDQGGHSARTARIIVSAHLVDRSGTGVSGPGGAAAPGGRVRAGPGKGTGRVPEGDPPARNHGGHSTHAVDRAAGCSLNTVFGVGLRAWLIAKYRFSGRNLLITLIDLPFSVAGYFGPDLHSAIRQPGLFGQWLSDHDIKDRLATPGIVLATAFVTFPFVARRSCQRCRRQAMRGEAALVLGRERLAAVLPDHLAKNSLGLNYGVILCNAARHG